MLPTYPRATRLDTGRYEIVGESGARYEIRRSSWGWDVIFSPMQSLRLRVEATAESLKEAKLWVSSLDNRITMARTNGGADEGQYEFASFSKEE